MKFVYGAQRSPEGAHKRPFRKLKVAAGILTAAIFTGVLAVGCIQSQKKSGQASGETAEKTASDSLCKDRDSIVEARGWYWLKERYASWWGGCDTNREIVDSEGYDGTALWAYHQMDGLKEATHALRQKLISDGVDEYEWRVRIGLDPCIKCHKVDSLTRREDSLSILYEIGHIDREELELSMERCKEKPREHRTAAGWSASVAHDVLNNFKPMLPEARKRRDDSLFIYRAARDWIPDYNDEKQAATYSEFEHARSEARLNSSKRHVSYDACVSAAVTWYERVKLPDGRTRRRDSIDLERSFSLRDREIERDYKEYLAEEHYKEWGLLAAPPTQTFGPGGSGAGRTEPHRPR